MNINLSTTVVGIALSACAFSSSTTVAFLHSLPRSSKSPLFFRGIHHNNDASKKENNRQSNLQGRTHLAYYPSDEPLSERLNNVQAEWDNVKFIQEGIKSITDELEAAEKILTVDAESAEKGAIDVIEKGESDEYLLKPFAEGMVETGKILAKEMIEVRQEFDEVKASKIVEESAEGVARAFVLVEKDLGKVVQNVVSSLQAAEKVVQSAIVTMASVEGLTDKAKQELSEKLTDAAADVEDSIIVADSVAQTAKRIAEEDQQVMSDLTKTGVALNNAIDVTKAIAQQFKGTEGGAEIDAVSNTVDQAASIVSEDLSAAESLTDAVGERVLVEADAVIAMDESAERSVAAINAAKSSINDRVADNGSIGEALSKDAKEIQLDEAEQLAEAISKDTANDEDALEVLERSSSEVKSLIDAISDAVDKGEASTGMDEIEKKAKIVEKSLSNIQRVTEEITKEKSGAEGREVIAEEEKVGLAKNAPGDAMKDLQPENTIPPTSANDVKISEHDTMDGDSESATYMDEAEKSMSKVEKFAEKIEKEEGGAVETKSRADTEQNLAEERVGVASNEMPGESQPENRILTTSEDDDKMFEQNTVDVDSTIAHANHGDAVEKSISNIQRVTEEIKEEKGGAEGREVIAEEEKVGLAENAPGDAMKDLQPENTSANDVKISENDIMDVDSESGKNVDEAEESMLKVEKFTEKIEKEEGGAVEIKSRADTEENLAEEKSGLAGNELQGDSQPENEILTTSVNVDSTIAHANHGDAISSAGLETAHPDSISSNLADTAVINGDPPIEFGVLLAKSGNPLSEFEESMVSLSGAKHDVATLTREALTEVADILSSLLSS